MELKKKDCLEELSTTTIDNAKDLAPYIAAAVAEVFGGTVTCIEDKDPVGFYYRDAKNISSFVLFRDLDYKKWMDNPPTGVRIDLDSRQRLSKFISNCKISTSKEEYTTSFIGNTQEDAEFISVLIACLMFRRNSYLSEGMEFTDRMQLILSQRKEKSTMSLWGKVSATFRRLIYGGSTDRCTRVRS